MRCLSVAPVFLFIFLLDSAQSQKQCVRSSCYPATGDLLIGRESQLSADSTCGLHSPKRYCILSHLIERNASAPLASPLPNQQCFVCDSTQSYYSTNSHRIENVVSKIPRDRSRWWQSANGLHNVSIQLDLEAEFHFTHLIMTFKTFRPAAMYIERSFDFGNTWRPYRYYSSNCLADFPKVSRAPMRRIGDVVCSSDYTDMEPSTGGEVIFRAVPSHLQKIDDPYSEEVQELVKLTNLRIVFTRLHTLGDLVFDSRPEVINNYYYALYELNVRGSCSCYGHAERCVPSDTSTVTANMVYGKCECTHHTTGMNCHECEPFYGDLPWKPATLESSNECKKCECNQHATRCHFDAAVFTASGGKSGGVCDECAHNTQGKNCQECKPFFYQDRSVPLSSPEVCKACNCNPYGSENNGECEQKTDLAAKTIAGRCICKKNAGGKRCDRCKPGYWNFRADNKLACDKCKCDLIGTYGNLGCDQNTGECTCKRFVTGDRCHKCMPGHFGLSKDNIENGCSPCECSRGGSTSPYCDIRTGACPCKPGMEGRRCDKVTPGFFVPKLDAMGPYEAEIKKSGGTGIIVTLPDNVIGKPSTHTGTGGVLLGPGKTVDITITPPPPPGDYEIVIRVKPSEFGGKTWPNFIAKIIRPSVPDPNSYCGKKGAKKEESFSITINATDHSTTSRAIFIPKKICINPNETIIIRLQATPGTKPTPNAEVFVDSVILVPDLSTLRPDTKYPRTPDDWAFCKPLIFSLGIADLPARCRNFLSKISVDIYDGPKKCSCSETGSMSSICTPVGGQCICKPGVTGRSCDRCKDEHYGFGPTGCKPCRCEPVGSYYQQCDPVTGNCPCKDNAYGRRCNECKRGFWSFPVCRPCLCNRHADTCDAFTGVCKNCSDYTAGDRCERCRDGYYGNPIKGIPCKPCLCPGGKGGIDRSKGCILDELNRRPICLCKKGYDGPNCGVCATNYYGNPHDPLSECRPCGCNNNIDRSIPDSCDSTTGICLKCQHFTTGSSCHECLDGYYGNATKQQCLKCICFTPGTKGGSEYCDKKTGQCDCLPNVVGKECDNCTKKFWKLGSKKGCEPCNCDSSGTVPGISKCNMYSGQCKCRPGRGGRDCRECELGFWGRPATGCKPCNCNLKGSKSGQCERRTGKCICKPGVAGEFCDRCDYGTRGFFPDCVPCGECWINWNRIIIDLLNETEAFRRNAGKISGGFSLPKGYLENLVTIEKQLGEIAGQLGNKTITSSDLQKLKEQLETIKRMVKDQKVDDMGMIDLMAKVEKGAKDLKSIDGVKEDLMKRIETLKRLMDEFAKESIKIKESNLAGAYDMVEQNKKKSDEAEAKIASVNSEAKVLRTLLDAKKAALKKAKDSLGERLRELNARSTLLKEAVRKIKQETLPELNKKVCGGDWTIPFTKNPVCHASCGGGGCPGAKCGGSSVCEGSKDRLKTAEQHLDDAEKLLSKKKETLSRLMDKVNELITVAATAKKKAEEALDVAKTIDNLSTDRENRVKKLLKEMQELLNSKEPRDAELKKLLKDIENAKPPLTEEAIDKLKKSIEEKVKKLKDVSKILEETKKDRESTEKLKKEAEKTKKEAEEMLKKANEIAKAREDALKSQKDAKDEMAKLKTRVDEMDKLLKTIQDLNNMVSKVNSETEDHLKKANKALSDLENQKKEIETKISSIEKENKENADEVGKVEKDIFGSLLPKVGEAERKIEAKERLVGVLSSRAQKLKERIKAVADNLNDKLKRLDEAEKKKNIAKDFLNTAEKELDELTNKINEIFQKTREKVYMHTSC